jgi:2-iminobutanoate/2-iminopropanoate deaminase
MLSETKNPVKMKKSVFIITLLAITLVSAAQVKPGDKPIAPYSPSRITPDGLLFISGQIPIHPDSGKLLKGDISLETRVVMEKIGRILEDNGMDYSDLVKCTVFLTDIRDYQAVNEVYAGFFKDVFPSREAIEVANLPLGASIEISGIASKR